MNRNNLILLTIAIISLAIGAGVFQITDAAREKAMVKPLVQPDSLATTTLTDLDGNHHLLGDWQQPVLIINFWAPWCIPCRREIPALVEIQQQFEGKARILGLALDSVENIRAFEADHAMNYPSFLVGAEISRYSTAFGNTSGSLPFTAFLDKQRKLRYVHSGELTAEQLREKITELL
ncbi:MAG: TlpA family protein disulfide reductase [Gammaproteobacteria bacterium]|nr:TlpA family protein disulfide reductase [Gammaproteobacteria bacterium]